MSNLLVTIQYDGTNYHGWQVQQNALTVQEVFQQALEQVLGTRPDIKGCSRTDTGVHARMYGISFKTDSKIAPQNLIKALNVNLPKDIVVIDCCEREDEFHARYSAVGKEYVYQILARPVPDPFLDRYALFYPYPIDVDKLNQEAQAFVGRHDFAAFCSSGSDVEDTVRTVHFFEVRKEGDLVLMRVAADGFLYNMVRIMVGTLLKIQQGKLAWGSIGTIIESRDRQQAGQTAPAHGLFLNRVFYQ